MHLSKTTKFFIICFFLAVSQNLWGQSSDRIYLVNKNKFPNGMYIPKTFLGIHLNRWKTAGSKTFEGWRDYYQVDNAKLVNENGAAKLILPKGHGFYNYRKGVEIRILSGGKDGKDFVTKVVGGTLGKSITPGIAYLAKLPHKYGIFSIQYRPYFPSFNYLSVRTHGANVNWNNLHVAKNDFNKDLMDDFIAQNKGKKILFSMTNTPEWLAKSNLKVISTEMNGNIVTVRHKITDFGKIPSGTRILIRNSKLHFTNGKWIVINSSPTHISYKANTHSKIAKTIDINTDVLILSNNGGYGSSNAPKDLDQVNVFVNWLLRNYGDNISWIEGPNEVNSSFLPNGSRFKNQGQRSWWYGSLNELAKMQKRIYTTTKLINTKIKVGAPPITGLHPKQPINATDINQASQYRLLTASDGEGGMLIDWVDFIPFHVYGTGANVNLSGENQWTILDILNYLKSMLRKMGSNSNNVDLMMNEGGFENMLTTKSTIHQTFHQLNINQQSNEIFKQAVLYSTAEVTGFYPWPDGFLGDYEANAKIAETYDEIFNKICGKIIHTDSWFNPKTGKMFFKTTDGFEKYIK